MTTTTAHSIPSTAEATLRKVLLINTELSITTGLIALVFGASVADWLGVEQVWLIRLLGAGLVAFAGIVWTVSRSSQPTLQRWSREISQADFGWVLGTIAVIVFGWLSASGAIIMAAISLAVGGLGVAQHHYRAQMMADFVD